MFYFDTLAESRDEVVTALEYVTAVNVTVIATDLPDGLVTVRISGNDRDLVSIAATTLGDTDEDIKRMNAYVTMTRGGSFGQRFDATNDEDARLIATVRGYVVLDVMDADDLEDDTVTAIVVVRD